MHLHRVTRPVGRMALVLAAAACSADPIGPPTAPHLSRAASAGDSPLQPTLVESDWEQLPSLPEPRIGHGVVVYRDCLWSIGGQASRSAPATADVWRYCPSVDATRWVAAPRLPRPLVHLAGAGVIGDRIYVAGGVMANGQPSQETYEFEPGAGWRLLTDQLPVRMACGGGGAVVGGKLYVYGGQPPPPPYVNCDFRREMNDFAEFDPAAPEGAKWRALPPAPIGHVAHCSYRTLAIGNRVYLTNGGQCWSLGLVSFDFHFDATSQSWRGGGFQRMTWFGGGAVVGNRIFLYGGKDWSHWSSRAREVTVMDTAFATLSADKLPPLPMERHDAPGVDFRGDLVLVGGSSDGWSFAGREVLRLRVQPGCDVHEPDDTLDRASPFPFDPDYNGTVWNAAVHHARLCASGDVDFFELVDTGLSQVRLELLPPSGTNYRLVLYDASGTEVGRSERSGSSTEVVLVPRGASGYRVEVSSQDGSFDAARPYTLRVRQ
jgi:hypothetical protein